MRLKAYYHGLDFGRITALLSSGAGRISPLEADRRSRITEAGVGDRRGSGNAFWSGGVSNPLSVIEQITYLLFIKRLDELHTLDESNAETLGIPMERRIFPEGVDVTGRPYEELRWSRFRNFEAREMMAVVVARRGGLVLRHAHARCAARFLEPQSARQGRADARRDPDATGTPRATSTSTCSAR